MKALAGQLETANAKIATLTAQLAARKPAGGVTVDSIVAQLRKPRTSVNTAVVSEIAGNAKQVGLPEPKNEDNDGQEEEDREKVQHLLFAINVKAIVKSARRVQSYSSLSID